MSSRVAIFVRRGVLDHNECPALACGIRLARQRRFRAGGSGLAENPDRARHTSSMNIYQDGERSGFCEFSTSVEMEMANLDEDKPPPEGGSSPAPATRST